MIPNDEELTKLNRSLVRYAKSLLRDYCLQKLSFDEEDLAMKAIIVFLEKPAIYDSAKGSLGVFLRKVLKNNLLNEVKSANTFTKVQSTIASKTSIGIDTLIEERIDYELLVSSIENGLDADPVAHQIFKAVVEGLEKNDICKKFNYDDNVYYNGIRRIRTVYSKVRPYEK